jgi:hypothetical protein
MLYRNAAGGNDERTIHRNLRIVLMGAMRFASHRDVATEISQPPSMAIISRRIFTDTKISLLA